jgi:Family of unknown function (DUF6247)
LARAPDASTESEERSEVDRLIDALQPRWTITSADTDVDVIFVDSEHRRVVAVETKRYVGEAGKPVQEHEQHALDPEALYQVILRALSASKQREMTLAALARAALERLRYDSVFELADQLDKSVEELEAERDHAAQVEGDREPEDPYEILKILPEQYHDWFLADYRRALRAAYPTEGFLALTRLLHKWRLRAEQYADPAYQRNLEQARMAQAQGSRPPGWRSAKEVREQLRAQGRMA